MLTLRDITFSNEGRRVDYHYDARGTAERFFRGSPRFFVEYDRDVSACPRSILAVPFITNFEPIGWFAGFDIVVAELDATFAATRRPSRDVFARMYPGKVRDFGVKPERLVANAATGDRRLMLFSGGLDAAVTLLRHADEPLILATVHGADIALSDSSQWRLCLDHIRGEPLFASYPQVTIVSNLRDFYNEEVDARLFYGWWGHIQHGHALLGLLAPLSHVMGASTCYIAGGSFMEAWGSTGAADQLLAWAGTHCVHDAEGMTRQAKAALMARRARELGRKIAVRICYSGLRSEGNCGRCEKCYRTILNFVLEGADPRDFGLPMDSGTYAGVFAKLLPLKSGRGIVPCWQEISEAARAALASGAFFVLEDAAAERRALQRIADGEIDRALQRNLSPWHDRLARLKFIARVRCPRLHRLYRRLRGRA